MFSLIYIGCLDSAFLSYHFLKWIWILSWHSSTLHPNYKDERINDMIFFNNNEWMEPWFLQVAGAMGTMWSRCVLAMWNMWPRCSCNVKYLYWMSTAYQTCCSHLFIIMTADCLNAHEKMYNYFFHKRFHIVFKVSAVLVIFKSHLKLM